MTAVRIIGIGSPFGEDRSGWAAIDYLRANHLAASYPDHDISLDCCTTPASELMPLFHGTQLAIVIDAMQTGLPAHSIRRFDMQSPDRWPGLCSSHGLGVREMVQLAVSLGELPDKLVVLGIEMTDKPDTRPDSQLSLPPQCLLELRHEIESVLNDHIVKDRTDNLM